MRKPSTRKKRVSDSVMFEPNELPEATKAQSALRDLRSKIRAMAQQAGLRGLPMTSVEAPPKPYVEDSADLSAILTVLYGGPEGLAVRNARYTALAVQHISLIEAYALGDEVLNVIAKLAQFPGRRLPKGSFEEMTKKLSHVVRRLGRPVRTPIVRRSLQQSSSAGRGSELVDYILSKPTEGEP